MAAEPGTEVRAHGWRAHWWRALGRVGLTESKWGRLPEWQRRLVKAAALLVLGIVVLGPIYGFDGAAFLAFLVVTVIYVPDWGRYRFGHYVLPLAVLTICVLYPYYYENLPNVPIFNAFPSI